MALFLYTRTSFDDLTALVLLLSLALSLSPYLWMYLLLNVGSGAVDGFFVPTRTMTDTLCFHKRVGALATDDFFEDLNALESHHYT